MKQTDPHHITSCTITWINGEAEGPAKVITRVLQTEIQVRFYNERDELLGGRLWPMSDRQRQELFSLLDLSRHEWNQKETVAAADRSRWQLKVCTKGKCLSLLEGTAAPLSGERIKDLLRHIVGNNDCYFY